MLNEKGEEGDCYYYDYSSCFVVFSFRFYYYCFSVFSFFFGGQRTEEGGLKKLLRLAFPFFAFSLLVLRFGLGTANLLSLKRPKNYSDFCYYYRVVSFYLVDFFIIGGSVIFRLILLDLLVGCLTEVLLVVRSLVCV